MIISILAWSFAGIAVVFAVRYALGSKVTVRFRGGRITEVIPKNKTLEILQPRDLIKAQERYREVAGRSVPPSRGLPDVSENALLTYFRELNKQLNLRQKIKTGKAWQEFYEQVTQTAVAFDDAASTYYKLFGHLPFNVPLEYKERIERKIGRQLTAEDFVEEEASHTREVKRDQWSREIPLQRLADATKEEDLLTAQAKARLERIKIEQQIREINQPKPEPAKRQRPLTTEEKVVQLKEKMNRSIEKIKGGNFDPEVERRLIEKIKEDFEKEARELYV